MRSRIFSTSCLFVLLSGSVMGQSERPFKDLIFGQVAAGGGYETQITATNRGTAAYTGNLYFYQGAGQQWNPTVDGQAITGGSMPVSIPAGATLTWKISGGQTPESGFAAFVGADFLQTAVIEGNLTFFVKSGDTILDSVGVLPSKELYMSTIPFEDFLTVALALVNRDPSDRKASVRLTVFSQSNVQVATRTIDLPKNTQYVKFLWQEFERFAFGRGRVEVQSNIPVAGTALMFVQGQFSSLPLLPTMRTYQLTRISGVNVTKGQMNLWAEGLYFRGFAVMTEFNGIPVDPPQAVLTGGELASGILKLVFYIPKGQYNPGEIVAFATSNTQFSLDQPVVDFLYMATYPSDQSVTTGTFRLTQVH